MTCLHARIVAAIDGQGWTAAHRDEFLARHGWVRRHSKLATWAEVTAALEEVGLVVGVYGEFEPLPPATRDGVLDDCGGAS